MTDLARRLDRRLFGPGPASRVWGMRAGLLAIMAVRLAVTPYHQLSTQPDVLFRPPTFWHALDRMPPEEVFYAVQAVGLVAAVLALAGRRVRLTFAVTWLAFVFVEGLIHSRAKISHHQLTVILPAVPLLLAPAVTTWKDRREDVRFGWPVRTAMAVLAGAYVFSGWGKVASAGWTWVTSDNMKWILASGIRSSKPPTDFIAEFIVEHDLLAPAIAFGTLALELSFFVVLISARSRWVYAFGAVALHVGIYLTLGLDYWSWVVAVVVLLLPWEELLPGGQARSASRATRPSSSWAQAT